MSSSLKDRRKNIPRYMCLNVDLPLRGQSRNNTTKNRGPRGSHLKHIFATWIFHSWVLIMAKPLSCASQRQGYIIWQTAHHSWKELLLAYERHINFVNDTQEAKQRERQMELHGCHGCFCLIWYVAHIYIYCKVSEKKNKVYVREKIFANKMSFTVLCQVVCFLYFSVSKILLHFIPIKSP